MFKIIGILLALFLVPMVSVAGKLADKRFPLNQGFGAYTQLGTEIVDNKVHLLRAKYKYSEVGGAVGTVSLLDVDGKPAQLPEGAVIVDCLIDVITAPTSAAGSPTIAFGTGMAGNDLKTATAIASYTGRVACIPVGTAATAIKMTGTHTPTATIASAALAGGDINVLIQYILSE